MSRDFAVLDFKCNSISAISARWGKNGEYVPVEFLTCRSSGLHRGVVIDLGPAADSVSLVLGKLMKKTGRKIKEVYAGITPSSVKMLSSSGTLFLSKYGREITPVDMEECVRIASIIKLPLERDIIHRAFREFSVDSEKGIRNPLGLEGVKLHVEMNILTVESGVVSNIKKCISAGGFIPAGIIFSGIAYGARTLTGSDIAAGAVLIIICSDSSAINIFYDHVLQESLTVRTGMNGIVSDNGIVMDKEMDQLVSAITSLRAWGNAREVVVTGEASFSEGLLESLEVRLGRPVRFGSCISKPLENLLAERTSYIGALGMLDQLYETRISRQLTGNVIKRVSSQVLGFLDKYF